MAVRPRDLQQLVLKRRPSIVHITVHGNESGKLLFVSEDGRKQAIEPSALASLFAECKDYVECAVLNACNSDAPAMAVAAKISNVIGMKGSIPNPLAVRFSVGFYGALKLDPRNFHMAFLAGCRLLEFEAETYSKIPVYYQNGVLVVN